MLSLPSVTEKGSRNPACLHGWVAYKQAGTLHVNALILLIVFYLQSTIKFTFCYVDHIIIPNPGSTIGLNGGQPRRWLSGVCLTKLVYSILYHIFCDGFV